MKKTTLILAIAALTTAPLAAMADINGYASVRAAVSYVDTGDGADAVWDVTDHASRFGFKGSEDLGNGMKAIGQWEFRVRADNADIKPANGLGYVGVSGDFGTVSYGRQWSPFYMMVTVATDRLNSVGANLISTTFRVSDVLSYQKKFGGTTVQVIGVMDGSDDDLFQDLQIGANIPLGAATLAIVHHNKSKDAGAAGTDGSRTGLGVSWSGGPLALGANFVVGSDALSSAGAADDETDIAVYAGYNLGNGNKIQGAIETSDNGSSASPTGIALGYQKTLSKSSRFWVEMQNLDADDGSDADTALRVGLRKDW